ncbi:MULTISPECIES: GGDEF domain-containing protein [Pigmentiphaga]|uniref:diguanylate cyclase n=2 Tax=Pigmentiphaga TaxID=152267 RepID=A0ABN1CY46_9BURK|nr:MULTISPECIES: GGDEF domain-containing protein [unclassified Pigmentiphaga]OVZ58948.1 hypothetical protein CDO46_24605 [Pigmentiphaga sp. NML030171]
MDAKSVFATVALMVLANGAVLANVYRGLPWTLRPAAIRWQAGTALVALGSGFFAFGSGMPMPVMVTLANGTLLFGLGSYHRAFERFYGRRSSPVDIVIATAAVAGTFWLSAIEPCFICRIGLTSAAWSLLLLRSMWLLHEMRTEDESRSRRMLIVIYGLVVVYVIGRVAVYLHLDVPREATIATNDYGINLVSPMFVALLPVIGTTAFVLLCAERVKRQLEIAAATDYLTGLPNRRTLVEDGNMAFRRTRATGAGLAVGVIDIDHFKRINDTHGHGVGDEVLAFTADCLKQAARKGDLVARTGGEEFVVLMDDLDLPAAVAALERIRVAVADSRFSIDGAPVPITISAGVASCEPRDRDFDDVFRRADRALYLAKLAGRDRVKQAVA